MLTSRLADFINHGFLPFVGRSHELDRILTLWRSTSESHRLRAVSFTGEAGVGKSRLVQEALSRISSSGGLAIHVKLYAGSSSSIVPMLVQSIWDNESARQLLRVEPSPTLPDVASAMRRLARLRSTVLILEDIHLFTQETLRDFALLLDNLEDETLLLLCFARPVEIVARGVLERFLVEEHVIGGLAEDEIASLWAELFDESGDIGTIKTLTDVTNGNALAIRSALRGALKNDAIVWENMKRWIVSVPVEEFRKQLNHSVSTLSSGLASHLTESELRAAEQLACLGEVFSVEAAGVVVESCAEMLAALQFKGIIVSAGFSARPLTGSPRSDHHPMAFTHSLAHQQFIRQATVPARELFEVIGRNFPVYSIVPFILLTTHAEDLNGVSHETADMAIRITMHIAEELDTTPDWKYSIRLWECADAILRNAMSDLPELEMREHTAKLLARKIYLLRRDQNEFYNSLAGELFTMTENPETDNLAISHMTAIWHLHEYRWRQTHGMSSIEDWEEMKAFTEKYPAARNANNYIAYLRNLAAAIRRSNISKRGMGIIDDEIERLQHDPIINQFLKSRMRTAVLPNIMNVYTTESQRQRKIGLLEEVLGGDHYRRNMLFALSELLQSGQIDRFMSLIDDALEYNRNLGMLRTYNSLHALRMNTLIMSGAPLETILAQADVILPAVPEVIRNNFRMIFCQNISAPFSMTHGREGYQKVQDHFGINMQDYVPDHDLLQVLYDEDMEGLRRLATGNQLMDECVVELLKLLTDTSADREESVKAVIQHIDDLPITQNYLLTLHSLLMLRDMLTAHDSLSSEQLRRPLRECILKFCKWIEDNCLPALASELMKAAGDLLEEKEKEKWLDTMGKLRRVPDPDTKHEAFQGKIEVRMLGNVSAKMPDGTEVPIKAPRLRAAIGLMALNEMLPEPLSHREFAQIASEENDPDKARKTLNTSVYRLRESVSPDFITTDGDTPKLNPDLVEVDVLQAYHALRIARRSIRSKTLMKAVPAIIEALEITRGEVPFPSLYDEIFESARDEFENLLRETTVGIANALLKEGDAASAADILRRAKKAMPGDIEVSELFEKSLLQQGKKLEATRVKLAIDMDD